eukprot:2564392-Rhodomonas_salina.1
MTCWCWGVRPGWGNARKGDETDCERSCCVPRLGEGVGAIMELVLCLIPSKRPFWHSKAAGVLQAGTAALGLPTLVFK